MEETEYAEAKFPDKNKRSFDGKPEKADIRFESVLQTTSEEINAELEKEKYRRNYRNKLKSTIQVMIVVCAVSVLIATLVCPVLKIYGTSMTPTLEQGQIVVSISSRHVKTGQVIGVYYGNKILVKRCIASEGQWVDIDEEGDVYVDDKLIDEPYLTRKAFGECDIKLPYQVPEKTLFVMGDHRESSIDSRSTSIGCVSEEEVVGRIIFCIWPFEQLGIIK